MFTGVAIKFKNGSVKTFSDSTAVYMEKLNEQEIESYVKSGEPL